ncbi:hypothetical protein ACK8HX_12310 [Oryzobacter sp. R7]|uniref:hypothetical protein n=1 Tax=Oryzobacter faecalis TaxID=3388656 RepID=UPI00398D2387
MGTRPHTRILSRLATEHLGPAGLVRRGRGRVWLDDHGWWVGVVELQPSGFSRGTHLDVGVTWPWHVGEDEPHLSLGEPVRVGRFAPYESEEQFAADVEELLRGGLAEVEERRRANATPAAAASRVGSGAEVVGWPTWDAAVLHGIAGDGAQAAALFGAVASGDEEVGWWRPVRERADAWRTLVTADPDAFRAELGGVIRRTRAGLGLDPDHPALAAALP